MGNFSNHLCESVFIFDSGDFGLDWKRVLVRTFYEGGFLIVFCLLAAGEEKETRS